MKRRHRTPKLFRVVREEHVRVVFYVETTSGLKARQTPTPAFAKRMTWRETVGEALEVYSLPGGEQAIGYSWSTNEQPSRPSLTAPGCGTA
jgi:hypothetical protein